MTLPRRPEQRRRTSRSVDWGTCCRDLCVLGRVVLDWGTCAGDPSGDPPGSLWQRACTLGVRGEPAAAVPCCIGVQSKLGEISLSGLGDLSAAIHVLTYLEST